MDRSRTGVERFDTLDVLRGIAALAIVDFHMDDGIVASVCPHGYLAVDLFFVLSGFVMAHAYGDRLRSGRLDPVMFMRDRLIRLMPTIVLGSVLGLVFVLTRILSGSESGSPVDAVEAFLLGGILIPIMWETTLDLDAFPLDGPAWSLFSEIGANAVWSVLAVRANVHQVLSFVMALSALGLCYGCWIFGGVNFGPTPGSFAIGLSRVGYSFPMGIFLYSWRHKAPSVPLAATLTMLAVYLGSPNLGALTPVWDLTCVLILSPTIVCTASQVRMTGFGRRIAAVGATLSYPLYALHAPILREVASLLWVTHAGRTAHLVAAFGSASASLLIAWMAATWYDAPVRAWLAKKATVCTRVLAQAPPA